MRNPPGQYRSYGRECIVSFPLDPSGVNFNYPKYKIITHYVFFKKDGVMRKILFVDNDPNTTQKSRNMLKAMCPDWAI